MLDLCEPVIREKVDNPALLFIRVATASAQLSALCFTMMGITPQGGLNTIQRTIPTMQQHLIDQMKGIRQRPPPDEQH